jgi:hypothetical protein
VDRKSPVFEIPVPSTEISGPVRFEDLGSSTRISFDYPGGSEMRGCTLVFTRVRAYRHRAEVHCTKWHIENAYDTLVEVVPSSWAQEIVRDTAAGWEREWQLRHFMIYFDSAGSYEILADSWDSTDVALPV